MINQERQWQLLQEIGYERISASQKEKDTAELFKKKIEEIGGTAKIESFVVDGQSVYQAALNAEGVEYEVSAYYQCANTPEEGLTAPFYYLSTDNEVGLRKCEGCIVLVNGALFYKTYEKLIKAKAVGFIAFNGELRDSRENTDLNHKELRAPLRALGNIPGVNMRIHDAMNLVLQNPSTVTIKTQQDTFPTTSQNVISDIVGKKYPKEVIVLTAHYDSVEYSTGVYDNGAGSVILMELYHHFFENKPDRTLRFVWCGSEERGLLGSKAYVANHKDCLDEIVCNINVDVAGPVLGSDSAVVTGPASLVNYIDYMAKEEGYEVLVKQDIYSSDNMPFADKGIPAVSFARFGKEGMAYIHNRYDQLFFMDSKNLAKTAEFVLIFAQRIANAYVFPIPREMPEEMVKKIDEYLLKNKQK